MPKKLPVAEFRAIYGKVPRICADVVVTGEDGILLTKRNIHPGVGFWHIPGGTVLFGESLKDTVKRVAKEELGIEVEIIKVLGVIEFLSEETTIMGHALSIPHLVKITSGNIKLNNEASDYQFFKEIPENTIPEQKNFLLESNLI